MLEVVSKGRGFLRTSLLAWVIQCRVRFGRMLSLMSCKLISLGMDVVFPTTDFHSLFCWVFFVVFFFSCFLFFFFGGFWPSPPLYFFFFLFLINF